MSQGLLVALVVEAIVAFFITFNTSSDSAFMTSGPFAFFFIVWLGSWTVTAVVSTIYSNRARARLAIAQQVAREQNRQQEVEKKRKMDEAERQRAEESQERAAAAKAEAEARRAKEEAERKAQETEKKRRIEQLLASEQMIQRPNAEMVTCSNDHHYRYSDFRIESQRVETEWVYDVETVQNRRGDVVGYHEVNQPTSVTKTDSTVGCPLCRSTVFTFDNERIRPYTACGTCGYWHKGGSCPLCHPA